MCVNVSCFDFGFAPPFLVACVSSIQTLKKLKGKQEENKKREMSRLMSKLDAQDKDTPPMTPASEPVAILDDSINPEDTVR